MCFAKQMLYRYFHSHTVCQTLPPQQRDALHGNLGGWDPLEASLADAYSGISTPVRQAGSTPPLAGSRGDANSQPAFVLDPSRGPASCPGAPSPSSSHLCCGSVSHEVQSQDRWRPQSTQLARMDDLLPTASRQDVPLHPPCLCSSAHHLTPLYFAESQPAHPRTNMHPASSMRNFCLLFSS